MLFDFWFSEEGRQIAWQGKEEVDWKDYDVKGDPSTGYYLDQNGEWRHLADKEQFPEMTNEEKYAARRGLGATKWLGDIVLPRLQFTPTYFISTDARGIRKQEQQVELMQSEYYFPSNSSVYYAIATQEELDILDQYADAYTTASQELAMQFILGQKSLDNWENEIAALKDVGADQVLAVYQARYERYKNVG